MPKTYKLSFYTFIILCEIILVASIQTPWFLEHFLSVIFVFGALPISTSSLCGNIIGSCELSVHRKIQLRTVAITKIMQMTIINQIFLSCTFRVQSSKFRQVIVFCLTFCSVLSFISYHMVAYISGHIKY